MSTYDRLVDSVGATVARAELRRYLDDRGLRRGTLPEVIGPRIAIEIDGVHHLRPDVAHRDSIRDSRMRALGWTILRVDALDEEQLLRAVQIARAAPDWHEQR